MEKEKKKTYESPQLTSVTFKTEGGFAMSSQSMSFNAFDIGQDVKENEDMEADRTSYGWTDANNGSWF